jgi:hypothetical protein
MGDTFRQHREMTDAEVIQAYDNAAGHGGGGLSFYAQEMERRDAVRAGDRIERLTRRIEILTVVNVMVAAAAVVISVIALLHR